MAATSSDAGTRRDFLYVASGAMAGVGVAAAAWPFIDQMNPSSAALALASIEVDISKVTESDMEKMIKKLGGTLDAKTALERLQGGKLFLTKKVKVRAKGAGSKKRAAKKTTKSGAASTKKPRPSRSKAAIAARKAAKEAQGSKTSAQGEKSEGAASPKAHAQGEKHGQGSKTEAPAGGQG